MRFEKHIAYLAIASIALLGLLAVTAAPATASNMGDWSYLSEMSNNTPFRTDNGCIVKFVILNDTTVNVMVSTSSGTQQRTLSQNEEMELPDIIKIRVDSIHPASGTVWVYIATPGSDPTPTPGGTRITCDLPGIQALAGDVVNFPITIYNNNNDDQTYTLSASSGTGWGLRFVSGSTGIYKIFVPAHQSKSVTLEARTSGATGVGEKKITASVSGQAIDLFVYITSINQSADVSFDVSSKIASIGDKIIYNLKIKNLQSKENIYRLSASGLPGSSWYYRYKSDASSTEELSEVVIPANGERNLVIEIVPPYSVATGDYNFTATVTTPEGSSISKDLMLRLKSSVGMDMFSSRNGYDAKPGEPFTIDVYVRNTGNGAALTNVYLDTQAPDGWTVQVTPNRTNSITAGNSGTFQVKITPPGNIVASIYDVDITAKSDQAEKGRSYQVTVTVDSYIPYIGAGIILFVIGGLVLVYRKYGRR